VKLRAFVHLRLCFPILNTWLASDNLSLCAGMYHVGNCLEYFPLVFFFFWAFYDFIDRIVERDRKQGREKGNDMQ